MPRLKIEFSDEISAQLLLLGKKAPEILNSALYMVSFGAKRQVQSRMRSVLSERTGKLRKGIAYKRRREAFFRLQAPNLASIYEKKGADIFPVKAPILRWQNQQGQWMSSHWVRLEPRPFFFPSLRDFVASGEINRIAQETIDKEIAKSGVKL